MSIIFAILTIIFGIKAIIKAKENEDNKNSLLASICTAFVTFFTLFKITIPKPDIYPLDNEVRKYYEFAEVIIGSDLFFKIYYSLDGSDPKNGNIYTDRFTITETTTVVAKNRFLHFFWSNQSQNTFRFESVQNITANSVNNSIDDHTTVKEFFMYLIAALIALTVLVRAIRGELN